jgi:hypothetical protein
LEAGAKRDVETGIPLKNGSYVVQTGSPESFGHLTMAHPSLWAARVREFMNSLESFGRE